MYNTSAVLGMLLGLLSGVMAGSFSLPMKWTKRWSWEATWLVWSVCALLIIPWAIALKTVPGVWAVLTQASLKDMLLVYAFGMGWGLGAVFFGQSIAMIGMSLAFALCIGLATALGALIPMLTTPGVFATPGGQLATAGILAIVLGVAVSSLAGHAKDKQAQAAIPSEAASGPDKTARSASVMLLGLVLAVLGGVFSSMLNLAFNYSGSIKEAALAAGASPSSAADPAWALTLLGGLTTNVVYCSVLLTRNRTWADYAKPATGAHWLLAALMGAIWMPSVALYGRAAGMMGELGSSAGWGVYMGSVIVCSSLWGFVTGEWRGVHGKPVRLMVAGVAALLLGIGLIGYSTTRTGT